MSAQKVAGAFEFALDRFIPVEFSVNDDASAPVLACDRLIATG
jgi:hypothetical protein